MDGRLAAWLRLVYPSWRITVRVDRYGRECWWARHAEVPTLAQREAGLIGWLARGSLTDLMDALDEQAVRRRRGGGGRIRPPRPDNSLE